MQVWNTGHPVSPLTVTKFYHPRDRGCEGSGRFVITGRLQDETSLGSMTAQSVSQTAQQRNELSAHGTPCIDALPAGSTGGAAGLLRPAFCLVPAGTRSLP